MQSFNQFLGTQQNKAKYELERKANIFARNVKVCLRILEECYDEVSKSQTPIARVDILSERFDFISERIEESATNVRNLVGEVLRL